MQSLAQKSTSTILPLRSSAVSGVFVLIQPLASSGGKGWPTYAPCPGRARRLCKAIRIATAAISSTRSAQNEPPEVDSVAAAESGDGESVAKRFGPGQKSSNGVRQQRSRFYSALLPCS